MVTVDVRSPQIRQKKLDAHLTIWQYVKMWWRYQCLRFSGLKVADWLGVPKEIQSAYKESSAAFSTSPGYDYNPDSIVDEFTKPVLNPVLAFHESMKKGDFRVAEAWLYAARVDEHGKILRDPKIHEAIGSDWPMDYKIIHTKGDAEYRRVANEAIKIHTDLPRKAKESRDMRRTILGKLKEDGFWGDAIDNQSYDPNQYSEFAPLMGGPFYRQQYMYDFLKQVAYAFEAVNHNPLAKALVEILVDYSLGRRFDMKIKDPAMAQAWAQFDEQYKIITNVCTVWGKEAETYGDFLLDIDYWESIDPSTVWDIITDAEHVNDEYYAYQSYPTAYQMFTGFRVPGEPGSEKQKPADYIIKQIPAVKYLHMKLNCMSNEKRGRSSIFSILGWLKRIKDLYNAQVIREWLYSCFMWDVEVNGSQQDVNNYMTANSQIPLPGSRHVHNHQVKLTAMPALTTANKGGTGMGEELISFIAVALRIPTQFLNIVTKSGGGSGSRAGALTAAEPFTKKVEGIQARWESFLKDIFVKAMAQRGIKAKRTDVEILFPSVTKDATADTLNNIALCENQGWLDNQTAAEMAAKELNITEYNYQDVQAKKQKLARQGLGVPSPAIPGSRFAPPPQNDASKNGVHPGGDNPGGSEIHGSGAQDLKNKLTTL